MKLACNPMRSNLKPGKLKLLAVASLCLLALGTASDKTNYASELLMFDDEYCTWCRKWDTEIGVIYNITPESCHAPLRKIQSLQPPQGVELINGSIQFTPTFVLVHNQKEIGRITGYPGEDFFWVELAELIEVVLPHGEQNLYSANCHSS